MEVLGRDSAREAYRIATGEPGARLVGLVPDALIGVGLTLTGGRGHQTAYDWLGRNAHDLERTLRALGEGRSAPARFATVTLEED